MRPIHGIIPDMEEDEDNKWHGWKLATAYGLVIVFAVMAWIVLCGAVIHLFGIKV